MTLMIVIRVVHSWAREFSFWRSMVDLGAGKQDRYWDMTIKRIMFFFSRVLSAWGMLGCTLDGALWLVIPLLASLS